MTTAQLVQSPVPTSGSLVRVRGSIWIATAIEPGRIGNGSAHHFVRLLSVSEDRHGATAEVIWEVESDAVVLDAVRLPAPAAGPDGNILIDEPRTLDAFLNAVRWGSVTNADNQILESPHRSGIEIVDYQLEPLVRAIDMPRIKMLIADDVGLGKTIEAGLIAHELELRHRMSNCLIVCPAGLQIKWQQEMRSRFGLEFRLLNADYVSEVRRRKIHLNPLRAYPYLITSIDWIKRPERSRILEDAFVGDPDEVPRHYDLLILDEAHLAAPAGANYAIDSDRTKIIKHLAPYFEHSLFLTATPHNGHSTSFWSLLELLDPRRFDKNVEPTRDEIDRVMVRRLKADIRLIDPAAPFPERKLNALEVRYHEHEEEAYDRLLKYLARLEELNQERPSAKTSARFVGETLRKRLLSSPAAFATTIKQHSSTLTTKGHNIEQYPAVGGANENRQRSLLDAIARASDTYEDEQDVLNATIDAVDLAAHSLAYDTQLLQDLEWLVNWGKRHDRGGSGRLDALVDLINKTCLKPGTVLSDQDWGAGRLIVFTEYLDTHKYLYESLVNLGVDPCRIGEMQGGMDPVRRSDIANVFNHPPADDPEVGTTMRVLLCTDTASEGIDLHLHCHDLLHYDVPWNPSRMEQRNGRIDRHGQQSPTANLHHFTGVGSTAIGRDTRIEQRVAGKLSTVLTDLGGANPLFDQLKAAHQEAMFNDDTQLDRYEHDIERYRSKTALRATEQRLRSLMDDVKKRLTVTREKLAATPDEVAHTVNTALRLTHQLLLKPVTGEAGLYHVPTLSDEWAEIIKDLVDPVTGQRRLLTFDAAFAEPAPGPLHAHLNHPLVAHATALLRAQVWTTTTSDELHRVTSRFYDTDLIDGDYDWIGDLAVVAHARVLITGADGNRLHEEVVARAARFRRGRWAQLDADRHADLLWGASLPSLVPADVQLVEQWELVSADLLEHLTRRGNRIAEIRKKDLENRMEAELASLSLEVDRAYSDMRSALDLIQAQLKRPQGSLFNEEETAQMGSDFDRLNYRYRYVREKLQTEIEHIRSRYARKDVHIFPITVTFLHPTKGDGNA